MEVSNNDKEDIFYEDEDYVYAYCYIDGYEDFYKDKENKDNKIWRTDKIDTIGELNISFDRKKFITCLEIIHTICLKKKLKYLKKKSLIGQTFLHGERNNQLNLC